MAMNIDLKPGETQKLVLPTGEAIELTLQKKSGQQARIAVVAPPAVRIERPPEALKFFNPHERRSARNT